MPATIFSSASEVKSYGSNLSLNDVTKILSVSGNPASGAGTAAPVGSIALDYSNGKTYKKTGSLATEWAELGSGVGGINYIVNPDAESGTTGWSTYADAAGAQPVDGTGGSPSVTWTRSTTTPLRGTGDFNFVKDAVNRQGQGVSYDVTVDNADLARVLTVSFDYEVLSGTYATGDLTVYLIQDPTGTPVVIQPTGYQVVSATAGTKMTQIATFQTDVAQKSYRLCFHVATTSASAYTLALDNIVLGPTQKVYGAPVTDWVSYTPTITTSSGTMTNYTARGRYRRVGDELELTGEIEFTGAVGTWTEVIASLPAGLSIDTSKLPSSTSEQALGITSALDASVLDYSIGKLRYAGATTVQLYYSFTKTDDAGTATDPLRGNGFSSTFPFSFGTGDKLFWRGSAPILGWSSNVEVSSSTDTRVVTASYVNTGGKSIPNNTQTTIDTNWTKLTDTHNAFSNGVFTCPVAGNYVVGARFLLNSALNAANSLFNITAVQAGSATNTINIGTYSCLAATTWYVGTSGAGHVFSCQAGDTITIQCYQTLTAGGRTLHTDSAYNSISISRLSGPSQIAASETVAFAGQRTSGSYALNNSSQTVTWGATLDTHGAYSGTAYTIPVPGIYEITTYTAFASATNGTYINIAILVDGVVAKQGWSAVDSSNSNYRSVTTTHIVRLTAGKAITVNVFSSGVANAVMDTSSANAFLIKRIGT